VRSVVTRFAPSPSGYLHLGHAASAAKAFGYAEERSGVCLLRIEDIDTTRCKPEFEQAIYEDLAWLGFKWPAPVRKQSDHFADYGQTLKNLRDQNLVYRCFKTRKEILSDISSAPHGRGEVYVSSPLPKAEEEDALDQNKAFAWRLSIQACRENLGAKFDTLYFSDNGEQIKARPEILGDVILARKDVGTSYHIACTHDDALQDVTDIVRGIDLLDSTHIHRLLQELMNWPVPRYHHHALLVGADGKRYAKRDKALTLRALRQMGTSPENILAQAASLG
jgi:glutamyl-Q tRNA(Asp) synthetase